MIKIHETEHWLIWLLHSDGLRLITLPSVIGGMGRLTIVSHSGPTPMNSGWLIDDRKTSAKTLTKGLSTVIIVRLLWGSRDPPPSDYWRLNVTMNDIFPYKIFSC